jgi:hypothetical protein
MGETIIVSTVLFLDKGEIEKLVAKFGEKRRRLIEDSLAWLSEKENLWELKEPVDHERFIEAILERAI